MTQLRAVGAIRLSVRTDETTSPERQRAAIQLEAARRGAVIIGEAEDLDVSASTTTPFERPELGAWLKRPDDFDMLVWWRMDRAVRSMADMADLGRWAREHGKLLVFAEGPGGSPMELDMRSMSPVSELVMTLLAFAAQMESAAIKERVSGAMAALRSQGRYSGGLVPYGYRKVENPDGPGWKLEPDPTAVSVIEGIVQAVLDGKSLTSIAEELNTNDTPVPRDYQAMLAGRPTGGNRHGRHHERFRWTAGTLSKVLRSPALMGHRLHKGKTVRDVDGNPIMIGEPVLQREEFDELQAQLSTRTPQKSRIRKDTTALLLGVVKCAACRGNMYRANRLHWDGADYNCRASARGERCTSPAGMRADWLEDWVEAEFLRRLGGVHVMETVEIRGYDPLPELREVEKELTALYAERGARKSEVGRRVWQAEVDALERRAAMLEATPRTETRTEVRRTSVTYADEWKRTSPADRRQLLLTSGCVVWVTKGKPGGSKEARMAADPKRLKFEITDEFHAEAAEELAALTRDVLNE